MFRWTSFISHTVGSKNSAILAHICSENYKKYFLKNNELLYKQDIKIIIMTISSMIKGIFLACLWVQKEDKRKGFPNIEVERGL